MCISYITGCMNCYWTDDHDQPCDGLKTYNAKKLADEAKSTITSMDWQLDHLEETGTEMIIHLDIVQRCTPCKNLKQTVVLAEDHHDMVRMLVKDRQGLMRVLQEGRQDQVRSQHTIVEPIIVRQVSPQNMMPKRSAPKEVRGLWNVHNITDTRGLYTYTLIHSTRDIYIGRDLGTNTVGN